MDGLLLAFTSATLHQGLFCVFAIIMKKLEHMRYLACAKNLAKTAKNNFLVYRRPGRA